MTEISFCWTKRSTFLHSEEHRLELQENHEEKRNSTLPSGGPARRGHRGAQEPEEQRKTR